MGTPNHGRFYILKELENKVATIKDVAKAAKVSAGTVDRVLHNRGRVADEVSERIKKAIRQLNYEPNLMARVLSSKKTYEIAALIPDHKIDSYWFEPKLGIKKAEDEYRAYGINVREYTFNPYSADSFIEKANEVVNDKPDGIILSPIFYHATLPFFEKWKNENIPFVLFNTEIQEYGPLSYIGQDSYQSGLVAAKLIHYGNPEPCSILIAHIDEEINNAAHLAKKEQGFRNYFEQNNLVHFNLIRAELNTAKLSTLINNLDRIFQNNNNIKGIYVTTSKAYDIANYLEQKHIRGIKLIGYDLLHKNIALLNKGLIDVLINQNPKGQGYWGISHLVDHLIFKKEVPVFKYLPLDIITKENVNYYLDTAEH